MDVQASTEVVGLLTVQEAAKRLGLSGPRVRRLCIDRRLGQKVGRQWLIATDEVDQFARRPRVVGRPKKLAETS